ncbi:hypothetical protein SAMN02799622_00571 [Methylobacterium sp. UNC378MF]|uniref:hypothetical protein n=1 Tax=Methylobacterium sp. UNC378MF TaxID=1502748 RepID=UPI000884C98E|nr:hypothetical protein [Methylobacterium sp. UNC378MF]SDA11298.1 hypothetical protein SAMN02799622_00571 [Methylobacterium sp. UNC378MF]
MTITTSINTVGPLAATGMIQSAQADAALEHRKGLQTVTMEVPEPARAGIATQADGQARLAPQKRVVDISV